MATAPLRHDDSLRSLRRTLGEVRRRIRSYVAVEGLTATLAAAAGLFWFVLGIDRLFEPRVGVRLALLWIAGGAVLFVFYAKFLRRFFARFSDAGLALLLE